VRGDDVIDALLKEWDIDDQQPKFARLGNAWVMFPNPRYDPDVPERVVEHLLLAARGVEPGEEGVYFTGRAAQIERIVAWLRAGEPGAWVVTGPAGSGKSAILGRVVSLSNRDERARLLALGPIEHADPGEGTVHAHVHARGVTAERLVEALDEQWVRRGVLPRHPAGPRNRGELHGAIQRSGRHPVIVLDGLDEAGLDAWGIAAEVIRLLADVSLLLISTRDLPAREGGLSLVQSLGAQAIIDLGEEAARPQTEADVRRYVEKRLSGIAAAMDPAKVADAVVHLAQEQSEGLFLLTRVVTAQLRTAPLDTALPGWETLLDHSLEAAFDRDLSRLPPLSRGDRTLPQAARELLTALTWGYGAGLPDDVWPVIATALFPGEPSYQRPDVFWLLGQAGRYVVEDGEGGRAVYRLTHQRLVEHLRHGAGVSPEPGTTETPAARVAQALVRYYLDLLEAGQPPQAHTYLRRYVWRHCADAGEAGIEALRQLVARNEGVFLPDLANALNNLGIRYSELGRWPEALGPTAEALALRRELAAQNPAFRPDLASALNNLGARYSELGRATDADAVWESTLAVLPHAADRAFLLLRRAEARPPGDLTAVQDLLTAQSLVPDGNGELLADLHAVCRTRRAHEPAAFDAAWQDLSGHEPPPWLRLAEAHLALVWQWLTAEPVEAERQLLAEHASDLLAEETDIALDEIALGQSNPSAIEPFRDLIRRARQVGVEEAYRPRIAQALLSKWMDADLEGKRALLAERGEALLGADVAEALQALREAYPEEPALSVHEALLALTRQGHAELAFQSLSDPEHAPALLDDLARSKDIAALDPLTTLVLNIETTDPVQAAAWFHRAIAFAADNQPDKASDAVYHARRLDPQQVPAWLGLLVALAPRHPEVVPLSQALLVPSTAGSNHP
jgi:hypothetical protein